jgi:tRNA(Phe) wybutosine-synthesizing methylase Tyw3
LQNHTGNRAEIWPNDLKKNQQDYTGLEYSQSILHCPEKEMKTALILGICGISILKNKWMPLLSRVVPIT